MGNMGNMGNTGNMGESGALHLTNTAACVQCHKLLSLQLPFFLSHQSLSKYATAAFSDKATKPGLNNFLVTLILPLRNTTNAKCQISLRELPEL